MPQETKRIKSLKLAIGQLPDALKYPVDIIKIRVEGVIFEFKKLKNEWYLK